MKNETGRNKQNKRSSNLISLALASSLVSTPALALDKNGVGTMKSDAVVLYRFTNDPAHSTNDANGLVIKDLADPSHGAPLDLKLYDNTAVTYNLTADYFEFVQTNVLRSINSAQKIVDKCKTSNEITMELWVQNRTPSKELVNNESDDDPPIKQSLRIMSLGDTYFKEFTNFAMYQAYNDGEVFKGAIRTSGNSPKNADFSRVQGLLTDPFLSAREDFIDVSKNVTQHLILTRNKGGTVKFYRSDDSGFDTLSSTVNQNFGGTLSDAWFSTNENVRYNTLTDTNDAAVSRPLDLRLAFGNEASGPNDFASKPTVGPESKLFNSRNYPWVGKIYMAAVYCRALTDDEILGSRAPHKDGFEKITPNLNLTITPSLKKAKKLFELLNGVATPIFNPRLSEMATMIDEGRMMDAAGHAIEDDNGPDFTNPADTTYYSPSFYNITVRDFAAPMSTREESVNTELNDFIATVIGTVRDNRNAKELVSGNYFYKADPNKAAVPSNMERDILRSNSHYSALASGGFNLARVLVPETQKLFNGTEVVENPDTAGLITTRTFMGAHAIAGTNRRLVEYSFREFMCLPIEKWAYAQDSDSYIGRDIDRTPGGSHTKFTQSCRSCHARMDPLRGAFAYYTFSGGFTKNTLVVPHLTNFNMMEDDSMGALIGLRANDPGASRLPATNYVNYVVKKMNHNDHVFPGGHVMSDNSFRNAATDTEALKYFGWRSPLTGKGVHDFGLMLAQSEGFSRCMTKRVFKTLCKRDPAASEDTLIRSTATEFEGQGYQLKFLFKKIAGLPQCLGN